MTSGLLETCSGEMGVGAANGCEEPRGFVQAELSQEACLALSLCFLWDSIPTMKLFANYFLGKSVKKKIVTLLHSISRGDCPESQFGAISAVFSLSNQRVLFG